MKYYNLFFLTICLLFLISCGKDYFYQKDYVIPAEGWTYGNTLDFEVEIKDTLSIYNLYLDIEHTPDYPRQNIYVVIHTQFPNGKKLREQTFY